MDAEERAGPIRVLIADDHVLFRDGVRALLATAPDMELVGEAGTGDEAVTQAAAPPPDVRAVAGGEAIFSPAIAARLMEYFAHVRPAAPPQVFPELSDREREILRLIAEGQKNAEI